MAFNPNRFTKEVSVSFETGEQATLDIYFGPVPVKIRKLRSHVTKALADTDAGTITAKNSAGSAMASGTLTHAASAALNDKQSAVPTTNNAVAADSYITLLTAKTTAGGRAIVTVEYELTH